MFFYVLGSNKGGYNETCFFAETNRMKGKVTRNSQEENKMHYYQVCILVHLADKSKHFLIRNPGVKDD